MVFSSYEIKKKLIKNSAVYQIEEDCLKNVMHMV